ncbi:MAG TPA: hypothetical protein VMQ78_01110, partial [Candidatus Limnocylindria bacterium]|nr:hypothetical protein [Candidatus Limnocylindria bacterium]
KGQPVAFVVVESDLTAAANASVPSALQTTLTDPRAAIDYAGVHLSAQLSAAVFTLSAASDISVGSSDGTLAIRVRSLSASPLPAGVLDVFRAPLETSLNEFSSGFPFTVRRVMLREGCLSIMGTTPP